MSRSPQEAPSWMTGRGKHACLFRSEPGSGGLVCASFFSLGGGGLCRRSLFCAGRAPTRRRAHGGKRVSPVKRTHRGRAGCPGSGLAGSPRRPTQPSRMQNGCIGSRCGAVALTGEDRSPPPAATAAPVVRRRPRAAKARPDTSTCRGLPRRRCRRRRSRRVDRLMCSRVPRRCTCRSLTAIHAR